jgi:hypothetical protein
MGILQLLPKDLASIDLGRLPLRDSERLCDFGKREIVFWAKRL